MKVPESVKEGWQGGGLGAEAAARARPGRHRRWPTRSKQSNEVLHPDVRLPQNGPQGAPVQFSMRAGTTVCANGLSRLIMIWLPCWRRTRKPNLSSAATTCCPETQGKGSTRRLEFELGAGLEGSCGFALVLTLSQMREHGLGPFGRADLHP